MTAKLTLVMESRVFIPTTHLFDSFKYPVIYTVLTAIEIAFDSDIN